MKCIVPKAKDADLWTPISEEIHGMTQQAFHWKMSVSEHIVRGMKSRK